MSDKLPISSPDIGRGTSKTKAETAMRGNLERPGQSRQLDLVWFITFFNFGFVLTFDWLTSQTGCRTKTDTIHSIV